MLYSLQPEVPCQTVWRYRQDRETISRDQLLIQNDLLKEYIARGTFIYPPKPSLRVITDIFEFCTENVTGWNTISISGYHIREAGSTAVQEVAFTLANGIAYVQAAIDRGLNVDEFGRRLSFFFNVHNNFFEEIAKFRAARRMWAKIMKERFGAKDPNALKLRFHSQVAGSTLTAQQPREQYRACGLAGDGKRAGRNSESAYKLDGRSSWSSHRKGGNDRSAHSANYRL